MSEVMKQYAVVGNGLNKQGKPYSKCMKIVELREGKGSYLSANDVIYLEEAKPLLTVVKTKTAIV